ncbi:hypothetical protein [Xanthomonas prunicola]|uniref:Uncharacterized protein n=1 Tax=Xanthomonas prunicola TaxID=2053930 RepID=A0A9Q9J4M3_9XANT|nr:hypothetical protein [Xanthomonas prunicola]UXA66048.1 hypothetical protein M0D43_03105 [Xanthomonas prunicola]
MDDQKSNNTAQFLTYILVPAALIGAVVVGANYFHQQRTSAEPKGVTSVPQLQVVDVSCEQRGSWSTAELTFRNAGNSEQMLLAAFVAFKDKDGKQIGIDNSYLSPSRIPAGSLASVKLMMDTGGRGTSCALMSVQDREGQPIGVS